MYSHKKIIFCLTQLFCCCILLAQTGTEVLKKASERYEKEDYMTFNTQYTLFLDYTTKNPHEQYKGMVLKKGKTSYFKIKDTEFVSFNDYGLKINHEKKAALIEKGRQQIEQSPLSIDSYLKGFKIVMKESSPDYYICELTPDKISQLMIAKIILYIKKSDYSINKQQFYFLEKMESEDKTGKVVQTTPRLEVVFSPRTKNAKGDDMLLKKENYFTLKNNQPVLAKRLSKYQLYQS